MELPVSPESIWSVAKNTIRKGWRIVRRWLPLKTVKKIDKKFNPPSPSHRLEIKEQIQKCLKNSWKHSVQHPEAIIRDTARIDEYPDIGNKSRGISAWFKTEIKDIYHRGVEIFLSVQTVKETPSGWQFANYDEEGVENVLCAGRIPFDYIRAVDEHGDEFYNIPHIYCDFASRKGGPYEQVVYFRIHKRIDSEGNWYEEIIDFHPHDRGI